MNAAAVRENSFVTGIRSASVRQWYTDEIIRNHDAVGGRLKLKLLDQLVDVLDTDTLERLWELLTNLFLFKNTKKLTSLRRSDEPLALLVLPHCNVPCFDPLSQTVFE